MRSKSTANGPDASSSQPPVRLPEDLSLEPTFVQDSGRLREFCEHWATLPALAIDTEFVRERTFFPGLGLIQVGDGHRSVLVDPLAIDDLEPLGNILADPGVVKVLHSCSEDLEVFFHRFGDVPRPIFDTQTAATLAGFGMSLGYSNLVNQLCGVEVPKGETRSNWLQRPLRDAQLRYAALDVAYLLPVHDYLQQQLTHLGRADWLDEEMARLADTSRFLPDPESLYLQMGHPGLTRRELAVLRSVVAWRERQARKKDLPRNFVLPKAALVETAKLRPRSREDLENVRSLRPADRKRRGDILLRIVREVQKLPPEMLPERLQRPMDLSSHRKQLNALRQSIARRAEALDLPPEFLASRKVAERLLRRALSGTEPVLPDDLTPWRAHQLEPLLERAVAGS